MSTAHDCLPEGRVPVLKVPARPSHTNSGGDIFGGWIMSQVDIAGSIPAVQLARGRVVTVAVNSMTFLKPVFVGDLLSIYAEITRVGRSSMVVDMMVFAERNPVTPESVRVAEAQFTYVSVDEHGKPRAVPSTD